MEQAIEVGDGPFGIAISPNGSKLLVTNKNSNDVSLIDPSTNEVTATIAVGTKPSDAVFTADGSKAYVTNEGSNNVSVIDVAENAVTATIEVEREPVAIAITP